jgi:hypothetical protein
MFKAKRELLEYRLFCHLETWADFTNVKELKLVPLLGPVRGFWTCLAYCSTHHPQSLSLPDAPSHAAFYSLHYFVEQMQAFFSLSLCLNLHGI